MRFSDFQHPPTSAYALSSTAAVATLAQLREQAFPKLVDPPRFIPRASSLSERPRWPASIVQWLTRQVVIASGVAALVLLAATALPAWAAFQPGANPASAPAALSSVGTTGTAAKRVEDLGIATFTGNLPFVRQSRYLNAVAGGVPEADRFVAGAREASLAGYMQAVGLQLSFPYISDGISTKKALAAWDAAVAERLEQQAIERAASQPIWQPPAAVHASYTPGVGISPGTRIAGARISFYACIGNGFCGNMASGQPVFEGAAACSSNLPFGTRFVIDNDPTGRVFVCLDRGALSPTWVDVWFYNSADGYAWQSLVGSVSSITIVE